MIWSTARKPRVAKVLSEFLFLGKDFWACHPMHSKGCPKLVERASKWVCSAHCRRTVISRPRGRLNARTCSHFPATKAIHASNKARKQPKQIIAIRLCKISNTWPTSIVSTRPARTRTASSLSTMRKARVRQSTN